MHIMLVNGDKRKRVTYIEDVTAYDLHISQRPPHVDECLVVRRRDKFVTYATQLPTIIYTTYTLYANSKCDCLIFDFCITLNGSVILHERGCHGYSELSA